MKLAFNLFFFNSDYMTMKTNYNDTGIIWSHNLRGQQFYCTISANVKTHPKKKKQYHLSIIMKTVWISWIP